MHTRLRRIRLSKMRLAPSVALAALLAGAGAALAEVTLPPVLSDHAVLQRSRRTALWGKAAPGERVVATLSEARGETRADSAGRWRIELDLTTIGAGPFELVVQGENRLVVSDVLIGEVWLASGQSNMEFTLDKTIGAAEEIAASANPALRHFLVAKSAKDAPQEDCQGRWTVAGPATSGGFTATGYYFAKSIHGRFGAPVGLLHSSWGGTPVESWTSAEALESEPGLAEGRAKLAREIADYPGRKAAFVSAFQAWAGKHDRVDRPEDAAAFAASDLPTDGWTPVRLPGDFASAGLPDAGVIWIRKTVELHGEVASGRIPLPLVFSNPRGFETIYYNGRRVDGLTPETYGGLGSRHVYYPRGSIDGTNVIAVRLYAPLGRAGFEGDLNFHSSSLRGEWLAKAERTLPTLDADARASYPQAPRAVPPPHNRPSVLFNGMIAPLASCTLRGVIWYQGESNDGRAWQYRTAFPLMIADWRKHWGYELPFYFCQLSSFRDKKPAPGESHWAELRESQSAALALPKTGQAVLFDLGETGDVHPRNKKDVGDRLALIALNQTYGQADVYSGPTYESMRIEGGRIRLSFASTGGGLVARPLPENYVVSSLKNETRPLIRNSPGSELEGFAICGADRRWVWAEAKIEGNTVLVFSPSVAEPVAVRYAWSDSPTANLYNREGLPASPFRTDDFPATSRDRRFGF